KGQIDEAKLVGFPSRPIELNLHADGKRFRFIPRSGLLQTILSVAPGGPVIPTREARASSLRTDALARRAVEGVGQMARRIANGTVAAAASIGWLDRTLRNPETTYLQARLAFDEVDLAELVARLGIGLPYEITGKLSVDVQVAIPVNAAADLRAYRLRGRVQ